MARRWPESMTLVDSSDFDTWMKRSFNDDKAGDMMNRLMGAAAGAVTGGCVSCGAVIGGAAGAGAGYIYDKSKK